MRTMVEMHTSDPSYISRILDVCQELKVLLLIAWRWPPYQLTFVPARKCHFMMLLQCENTG